MPLDKENRRLYVDYANGYGISLIDVANCLRDFRRDKNGNIDLGMMCTSPKINMWAKYKPVRFYWNLEGDKPFEWWKGDDGWCGLDISQAKISNDTNVADIASHYTSDNKNGWNYAAPRGGDAEMFRLDDFENYNALVEPFVNGYTMPFVWTKDAGSFEVSFKHTITDAANADFISNKDLPMENYYLGLALVEINGDKVYRCTNDTTIEDRDEMEGSSMNMLFPIDNVDAGEYTAYPFMSDRKMTVLDGGFMPANVYTLPACGAMVITIKNKAVTLMIRGILSDKDASTGMYSMSYTVTIINDAQYEQKFSNNYIQLRHHGKKFTDPLLSDEKQMELNLGREISVAAGGSETIYGVIGNIAESLVNDAPIIWVSLDSSVVLQSATPEQNIRPDA